ncbi:MAG: hypothetical protein A3G37_01205 [Omnitrophica WOR_2 bacterium RIFCSPLOWO2_12_FULL_46_30]|nr:MAG: hypothetical protein A3D27_02795 [Omnitrophica WOR_2 bacterium RIFCSPHIGHO2_02_FULL_46_37]OGX42154.1 MAG: hypothetical protein A3H41_01805 [Omnitrophica WOR_2 bacterium RIFCSPLOWO2_02_FULL_45_28]OGX50029.1 MAG: hypothetical protein A3G37_01205 [Omnitrophica WOR_2 bacterium RIFCSPLOWO2_12_FULL_46_30]
MEKEIELFRGELKKIHLRVTSQRLKIVEAFLKTEKHITCDELYLIVRRNHPDIGYTTVYRTLKLIQETGLAREADLGDKVLRLEHEFGHKHHDHLICLKCGRFFEVFDPDIELLQEKLARKHKFNPIRHKMDIFGYCQKCSLKQ